MWWNAAAEKAISGKAVPEKAVPEKAMPGKGTEKGERYGEVQKEEIFIRTQEKPKKQLV